MQLSKFIISLILISGVGISAQADIHIIPRPEKVEIKKGTYKLTAKTVVISNEPTQKEANYLSEILEKAYGIKPEVRAKGEGIKLVIDPLLKNELGEEGYRLLVQSKSITIEGGTNTGVFYGIQSLRQLLPPEFEFNPDKKKTAVIPLVLITDKPRFPWRAFMLDESRHFKGMKAVKNLLDQMALLKMNIFHWHLTDDQGWRIEIKKYPLLTSIGSFRKDTQAARRSEKREGIPHDGFYTQEQIKEIIAYASERDIQIVPEIEMPGHAMAAIAAYPWLGVLGTTTEVPVTFGKMDDSFNVADPKVYHFLEEILTEVLALFPSKVVHIGGDEVTFETWKNSAMIQALIKKEGLSSPADLQIYFTNRISQFVDSSGHRMMGWNEILGDNVHEWQDDANVQVKQTLAKSAIIQFWKGNLELINKAVSNGYKVVNSYHAQTYLDYNYKTIPLTKAYSFDPIPEGLDPKYDSKILGLGCQMWSEWIPTVQKMNLQIFPRLAAYAEVGWTIKEEKDYSKFLGSLSKLEKRWDLLEINYHKD
ncbi:beta-N-acetylhexosaminidase [Labilibaculum euxinus]|uniref:beta-N-acetylhexosaminidase n=1 Tax=Labilibaculum euxinus TaxID=2686357 RepID=A0A7M4D958_9BACT|nr:beta-N-acetylhexosaminidase [Labilibaculum euxinus]MUP39187.1 family 20 glycosylhydrolase [Labilibaculum euxinus]MVB08392.1 family 20 glycosylhydrolase [Labilibaculum euxinus]